MAQKSQEILQGACEAIPRPPARPLRGLWMVRLPAKQDKITRIMLTNTPCAMQLSPLLPTSGDRRPHEHCSKEPRYPPVAFCAQVVQPLCSSSRTFRISAEAVVHNSVAQVAPAQPLKSDCLAAHCSIDSLVPISSSYTADDSITNTLCRRESETNEIRLIPHWSLLSP